MVTSIIRWAVANRFLVLVLAAVMTAWGAWALRATPVDAIPDLSDVQVIVRTSYPGQAPSVVEAQVTYPLSTALLAVPGAVTVRGYSFFGDSYVYVIFEDGTDLYWARSRVLEYLNQVGASLPDAATPALGPDATGVGWVYQYALVDRTGEHDLAELTSIQNWFLKYELQSVPGVAEVATVGGMVRQYQIVLDPDRLRAYGLSLAEIRRAVQRGNAEVGGSVVEMAEAEYMVRATGYVDGLDALRDIPVGLGPEGAPLTLDDVARIETGPRMRRGIAELDGEGEVVGGIVVMRFGENARRTIEAVEARLDELAASLPAGVEIVETYDRSGLIDRAVSTLTTKLVQELIAVVLVCAVFLFHLRSALVIALTLPLGVLLAFIVMQAQGINANIMSLGGIAIAIGAMVDAAIVMIENLHKKLERDPERDRWAAVTEAATEVGPPVFFSLLIITLSFVPVFALEGQEGRLFAPLAYTKTYAMAAAAALAVTLVPVLMGLLVRGRIRPLRENPANRAVMAAYRPLLAVALRFPRTTLLAGVLLVAATLWPASRLGTEFMPELDEGDLMYMPTTLPGLSAGKAAELLQQTDRLIAAVPEVERVFGKIGRADTATDPAPLTMIETSITLKPREEWRPGLTLEDLKRELDARVQVPGLTNAWVMPIKTRIDMLATGIKTPVGVKIAGPDLGVIEKLGRRLETLLAPIPGTASVYSERTAGGRYVTVDVDRAAAARYGMNIADVHDVVTGAVGGLDVAQAVEGLERYPINVRYARDFRDSLETLRELPVVAATGARIPLAELADIRIESGPAMIKSENARPNGWTFVDIRDRDLGAWIEEARARVAAELELPPGYSLTWAGQYEYLERAAERLRLLVPMVLAIIVVLLYLVFRRFTEVAIVLGTMPLALVGGFWLLYLLGYDLSVAVIIGFIALAGVAVEIGVLMLVYLDQALDDARESGGGRIDAGALRAAVEEGALARVRPIVMTVATILAGLAPIMAGGGTGAEIMQRIAAPMVGGIVSTMVLTLMVVPAVYLLWRRRGVPA